MQQCRPGSGFGGLALGGPWGSHRGQAAACPTRSARHPKPVQRNEAKMGVRINGETMTSDITPHNACRPGTVEDTGAEVSRLTKRRLTRNQATTAMVLAERVSQGRHRPEPQALALHRGMSRRTRALRKRHSGQDQLHGACPTLTNPTHTPAPARNVIRTGAAACQGQAMRPGRRRGPKAIIGWFRLVLPWPASDTSRSIQSAPRGNRSLQHCPLRPLCGWAAGR